MINTKDGLRKYIKKVINEEFSTFEPEDIERLQGDAYEQFLKDFHDEHPEEPLPTATPKETENIIQSLKYANLNLPSDKEDLKYAEQNLDKQLKGEEDPIIQKRKMDKLGGKDSVNETGKVDEIGGSVENAQFSNRFNI